jgi:outer membrane protein
MTVKKKNRRAVALAIAIAAGGFALPAASGAQTLEEALELARTTNPTIAAERARFRATKEAKPQAIAGVLPQVTAGGAYSEIDGDQTLDITRFDPTLPPGTVATSPYTLSTTTAQVQGELMLFNGFRNINAIRQANARIDAGGAQLAAVEQNVLLQTATAYFDLLRDEAVYASTANNVAVLQRQQREATIRFEVGEITKTDVAQSDARLAGARAQLSNAQAQLAISRARLNELIGSQPTTLEPDPALPTTPKTLDAAQALANTFAPGVNAARAAEEAARRQVAIAKSAFSPQISATAKYQYAEEPSTFVLENDEFSYGVQASVPIFLGGLNLSRVREARALHDAERRRVNEAERRAEADVVRAWQQLQAADAMIASAEAQLQANTLALDGVRREAELGSRSTLDVLNAEQEFLNAQVSLADARRNKGVAVFGLLASAGVLTGTDGGGAE